MEVTNIYSNLIHGCNEFSNSFLENVLCFIFTMRDILRRPEKVLKIRFRKIRDLKGPKLKTSMILLLFYCSSNFQYFQLIVKNKEYNLKSMVRGATFRLHVSLWHVSQKLMSINGWSQLRTVSSFFRKVCCLLCSDISNRCLYEAVICPVHRLHVLKTTKPGKNTAIYYIRNVHNIFKSLNTQQLQTERKKKAEEYRKSNFLVEYLSI